VDSADEFFPASSSHKEPKFQNSAFSSVARAEVTQGVTPSTPALSLAAGIRVGHADVNGARRNVRSRRIFGNFDSLNSEPSLGYLGSVFSVSEFELIKILTH
jgi:hypothetical protein